MTRFQKKSHWQLFALLFCGLTLSPFVTQAQKLYQTRELPSPVEQMSTYNYQVYMAGPERVLYYDRPVVYAKDSPTISVSRLGTEAVFLSQGKILKYNTLDFELISKDPTKLKDVAFKQIIANENGKKYYVNSTKGDLYELTANTEKPFISALANKWPFEKMYWHETLQQLLVYKDKTLWYFNPNTLEKNASRIFDKDITAINAHESEFLITVGFSDGSFQLLSQDLQELLIDQKISEQAINSIVEDPIDHYYYLGDFSGNIHTFDYLKKEIKASENYFKTPVSLAGVHDPFKGKKFVMAIGAQTSRLRILDISDLTPNYMRIVKERLTSIKEAFLSIKSGESPEAYDQRVNDNTLKELTQSSTAFLHDSIAATIAGDTKNINLLGDSLQLSIKPFEPISIKLFKPVTDATKLIVKEVHYYLKENNTFSIKSALITGDKGEEIKFSSDASTMLAYEKEISLALAKEVAIKEAEFKNSLSEAVANLKSVGKLNDVELSVNSALKQGKDTNGKDELNLHILFVSQGKELENTAGEGSDYPSGKYLLSSSEAASTLVDFFIGSAEGNLQEYLIAGRKVTLNITGATDKSGISRALPYANEYGAFTNFPYYFQSQLSGLNLSQESGIKDNSQLGFLRTYSVKDYIEKNTNAFENNPTEFKHFSEQADGFGAQFRKIKIELIIHKVDQMPAN